MIQYHDFHPEFWKSCLTSNCVLRKPVVSYKGTRTDIEHEFKAFGEKKKRGTETVTLSFNEPPRGKWLLGGELTPVPWN